MAKSLQSLVSFSSGEWSPTISARIDQQKYISACKQVRNMIPLKSGPATRRAGTQFEAEINRNVSTPSGWPYVSRLEPFIFSITTTFVLEFGQSYVRFYSNGQPVVLSTAPAWTALFYDGGTFVTDPFDNLIYYTLGVPIGPILAPHLAPSVWRQQNILEVPTVYNAYLSPGSTLNDTQVFQIQCCQINDVIYINHPKHPRHKLIRLTDTSWVFKQVVDMVPPLLDQNATDTTIAASATTGNINLTAAAPAWAAATFYDVGATRTNGGVIYQSTQAHVSAATFLLDSSFWSVQVVFPVGIESAYYQLAYRRPTTFVEYDGTIAGGFAAGTSSSIKCLGAWEVRTYGVWSADIALQNSFDGGITWQVVRNLSSRDDANFDLSPYQGNSTIASLFRLVISNVTVPTTPGQTNPRVVFECIDSVLYGVVQIFQRVNNYSANATVITELNDTSATPLWAEGAWSPVRGYPATITTFQQRVLCGGTDFQPQRIWGTKLDDLENWDIGTGAKTTDGFAFDVDAVGEGRICWLNSQVDLYCGMEGGEFVIGPQDSSQGFSAINIQSRRQSNWGSNRNVGGIVIGDSLVFTQSQALSLRQMVFSFQTNKYMSQDLTTMSDQILNAGIVQMGYQKQFQKNGILWCITLNGELVGLTFEQAGDIYGWHRHFTGQDAGDKFESVAVIPSIGVDDDQVWVVVNRQGVRYVERINPINWQNVNGVSAKDKAYYVDSGRTFTSPGSNVFTGFDHLNGRNVVACINAQAYPPMLVTAGSVTVANYTPISGDVVHIGLPFTSTLQPMNLDVDGRIGPMQGLDKRVTGLTLQLYNTLACTFGDGDRSQSEKFRDLSDPLADPQLFSGKRQIKDFPGDVGLDTPVIIETSDPLPLTVLAIVVNYAITAVP